MFVGGDKENLIPFKKRFMDRKLKEPTAPTNNDNLDQEENNGYP